MAKRFLSLTLCGPVLLSAQRIFYICFTIIQSRLDIRNLFFFLDVIIVVVRLLWSIARHTTPTNRRQSRTIVFARIAPFVACFFCTNNNIFFLCSFDFYAFSACRLLHAQSVFSRSLCSAPIKQSTISQFYELLQPNIFPSVRTQLFFCSRKFNKLVLCFHNQT